ncbi:MAG: hypothetical protein COX79_00090 [Candidatus Levybacteria bacterium CG_4_10_14_0_2_um_filter_36_16]|nr:MAG: hypothetical protein AUK12_00680 [Candidatus Levybacteria bacterium CG2_30_37_29]PIR78834.1 MAG: hypothetical protein COU26_04395 [Candidatus Levybacteria bacterium CG10_big_fil_rev_8_21_14_0_10_36_30]PIZ98039.1 MAG: hypothetical protein COX79_00090 [Candidatus Levybacteria bacterium CG_4_10_14_0_2_um_filter_36_16]
MKKDKIIIVTHTAISKDMEISGPAHTIFTYLKQKKSDVLFIRHSIYSDGKTYITLINDNNEENKQVNKNRWFGELSDRLSEGIITIASCMKSNSSDNRIIYFGVDPLNTFWGILLKKIGKVDILITFNTDFAPRKYTNSLYNSLYFFLDNLSIRKADYIIAVSHRIIAVRKKQGISEKKLIWLPNSPAVSHVKKFVLTHKDLYKLIMVSTAPFIDEFMILINAVDALHKEFPSLQLTIIGSSKIEKQLNKEIENKKLKKHITFLCAMSHDDVFKQIAKHGIGIAFYTNEILDKYYLDSMKARDYLALGTPVIISGDNGTVEDIIKSNAGVHIEATEKALISALKMFFKHKDKYQQFSKNAFKLADLRDSEKVLNMIFKMIKVI